MRWCRRRIADWIIGFVVLAAMIGVTVYVTEIVVGYENEV